MFKQYWPLLLLISGCASTSNSDKPTNFNYNAVENIEFKLQPLPNRKGISEPTEWTKAISLEISQRFADAGYSVSSSYNNSNQSASHVLNAQVEETRITKTQPGFSLDFGNSNPRSKNFQKTFSAPISCTLKALEDPAQSISLKELKSISSPFDNIGSSQEKINKKLKRFYIENIGSTCHNLLNRLQVKPSSTEKSTSSNKDTFLPATRIEIEYKSEKNKGLNSESSSKDNNKVINETEDIKTIETKTESTKKIKDEVIKNTQIESEKDVNKETSKEIKKETSKDVAEKDYFPAVTTEEKNTHDWRDAEVTIFNQGDTVILEFGNNR